VADASKPTWWQPSEDVVVRRLGDELVLIHLQTNRLYSLNRTGARFWELLAAGQSRAEVIGQLQDEFVVEPGHLEAEIDTLGRDLVEAGLLAEQP
jgi:hypothetical protein